MTHVAAFAQTPKNASVTVSTVGALNGSDATLLFTAGQNGSLVSRIFAAAVGATTAMGVNVYIEGGDGVRGLSYSMTLPASSASVDSKAVFADAGLTETAPCRLEAGAKVYVAITKALPVSISLQATDY